MHYAVMTADGISIHALRVEGDFCLLPIAHSLQHFYPRPPGGGRHLRRIPKQVPRNISIHALRVEGDSVGVNCALPISISIHALRVEGDAHLFSVLITSRDFYPRPPGGGRQNKFNPNGGNQNISIHALRVEGDCKLLLC